MADATKTIDERLGVFEKYSGADTEILGKLPNLYKRSYSLIGLFNICSALLSSLLFYFFIDGHIDSFGLKLVLTFFFGGSAIILQAIILKVVIHNSPYKFIFPVYGLLASMLFFFGITYNVIIIHPNAEEKAVMERAKQDSIYAVQKAVDDSIKTANLEAKWAAQRDSFNAIKSAAKK